MSSFHVEIADRQSLIEIDQLFLEEAVKNILREEQIGSAVISIALVDDVQIRTINADYLGHDFPTDVISFTLNDHAEIPGEQLHLEGELVISVETALRESVHHQWTANNELLLYVVHGLLHLCGYDDLTDEARPRMRRRERELLAKWELIPTGLQE